jgi:hypothetical protein
MGVTLGQTMHQRMTKRPIKIRNENAAKQDITGREKAGIGGRGTLSCSGEGFDVRVNLAT